MLDLQLRVERLDRFVNAGQCRLPFDSGRLGLNVTGEVPELVDVPHRVMHGAKLALELREQVELAGGQHLGVAFEGESFERTVRCVHLRNVWNAPARFKLNVEDGPTRVKNAL